MNSRTFRAVVAGASTALGRELAEQLNSATGTLYDIVLADVDAGHVTAAGNEPLITSPLEPATFEGADIVFFAGSVAMTRELWPQLRGQNTVFIDLTGALAEEEGAIVLAPGLSESRASLATTLVVAAHPATTMLLSLWSALRPLDSSVHMAATVMEPASQADHAGMDELHQQTVALFSFQPVPKAIFDTQVAFTLTDRLGAAASVTLASTELRVRGELAALTGRAFAPALQWLQAPLFHGYTASVWASTEGPLELASVQQSLSGAGFEVVEETEREISNQSATGSGSIQIRCVQDTAQNNGAWFWMAADNLQLAARTAVECAGELLALRPGTTLQ